MGLLEIIIIVLIIGWLGGFSLRLGGDLVHILLIIAVIIILARLLGISM